VIFRRFGTWAVLFGLTLPVWAAQQPGAISGHVRNATGAPQMGAIVEVIGVAARSLTVFTDEAGFFSASGLLPGVYSIRVSAPSFLPALRERIGLRPGASVNVNVTLNTLLGAIQVGPLRVPSDDEDWKWTLRSVANRPILRVFDGPAEKENHETTGSLSFLAGSAAGGYGSGSDLSTGFSVERSIFSAGHVGVSGNVGYGEGLPAAVLRTTFSHKRADGSEPSVALTVRRFAPSNPNLHNAALQSLALALGDDFSVGDVVELKFGSELQTIQFLGRVTAFRPYGSADVHLSPSTVLEYSYATSLPDSRREKGFDSSPADLSESNPRVSMQDYNTKIERAHHQEISLSRRIGKNNLQLAAFSDRVGDTALTGTGDVSAAGGFLLPDVYSGTFSYAGNSLRTQGLRVVLQRKFSADLTATLDYAYGGVLDLTRPNVELESARQSITTQKRHAVAAKLSGSLPRTRTRWITSYRWVNGPGLTPVDMFNASAGQSDPYLNLFIRQPIPTLGFLPSHMEAVIDVRNLLAQGYVPVLGQDGQTVYLVQSARSVRGGVAFTF
jgi:hypothetical protein